ncbi:MAG TPA: aldo/keto reductase [bacterium]|nr:aldo/keto reductase [bacterium]
MRYRNLGSTGLKVSSICLGAMTFDDAGKGFMAGVAADEKTSFAIMDRALEKGVNFIDTANVYGNGLSEEIVGRWLKARGKRDSFVVATKFRMIMGDGPNERGGSRAHIMQAVEGSLKRLQTDWIDLYQMHAQDRSTPIEETLSALDALVKQGKVRYVGASNFTGTRLVDAMWTARERGFEPFRCLQPQYSLVCRGIEMELLPACRRHGLGVIAWSPLGRGFLSGKYTRNKPPPAGTRLAAWQDSWKIVDRERNWDLLDVVRAVAKEANTTPARVSLAWVLAQPGITSVIAGARTVAQLDDNLGAEELVLAPAVLEKLEKASAVEWGYPFDFLTRVEGDWK